MKLLILGGTGWVSSHVARIALEQGHEVTCVTRRVSAANGAKSVRADRDEDDALQEVARETWDAVIDVAREPGHVRRAVRDLAQSAKQYIFVSTISVYADNSKAGNDEKADRLPPLEADTMNDMTDYGSAKVACEDAVLSGFGDDRSVIIRPGLIGGPGDETGRTTYWPWRFAHPAVADVVAVPDELDLTTSIIDARDLAAFIVNCVGDTSGIFNVLGEQVSLREHLTLAREVAVAEGGAGVDEPRGLGIPSKFLLENGVNQWAGEKSMPLWLADPMFAAMNDRSTDAALAAGLRRRALADTLRDGMWWRGNNGGTAGLSDAEEREIIAAWREASGD